MDDKEVPKEMYGKHLVFVISASFFYFLFMQQSIGREAAIQTGSEKSAENEVHDALFAKTLIYRKWGKHKNASNDRFPAYVDEYPYDKKVYQKVRQESHDVPPHPGRIVRWGKRDQITITMGPVFETNFWNRMDEFEVLIQPYKTQIEDIIGTKIVFTKNRVRNSMDETSLADITLNITSWRVEFPKRMIRSLIENPDDWNFYYSYEVPFKIEGTESSQNTTRPKPNAHAVAKITPEYEITQVICNPGLGGGVMLTDAFFVECFFGALGIVNREAAPYDIKENVNILRSLYSSDIRAGMSRQEVTRKLRYAAEPKSPSP